MCLSKRSSARAILRKLKFTANRLYQLSEEIRLVKIYCVKRSRRRQSLKPVDTKSCQPNQFASLVCAIDRWQLRPSDGEATSSLWSPTGHPGLSNSLSDQTICINEHDKSTSTSTITKRHVAQEGSAFGEELRRHSQSVEHGWDRQTQTWAHLTYFPQMWHAAV